MRRCLCYLWAGPTTLVGLPFVVVALGTGGKVRRVRGALEVTGGRVIGPLLMYGFPWLGPVAAFVLGHVIVGRDAASMEWARDHEHVHVRQCERWGPLFLPAYFAASLTAWWRGGHFYRDNAFEREAYDAERPCPPTMG